MTKQGRDASPALSYTLKFISTKNDSKGVLTTLYYHKPKIRNLYYDRKIKFVKYKDVGNTTIMKYKFLTKKFNNLE